MGNVSRLPRRRVLAGAGSAAIVLGLLNAAPALAVPTPDFEVPFPCGEQWLGTTRSDHSPSAYAIDWNRSDDLGNLEVATAPGVVARAADLGSTSYGKYVVLDNGGGNTSIYAHMQTQYVTTGQRVDQGQVIGRVGSSGNSTGPHLHFEERLNNQVQQPYFHQNPYAFGTTTTSTNCPDVPLAGDWNGTGGDEVGIFRRKAGTGMFRLWRAGAKPERIPLGGSSDTPLTGDWDGNGRTEVGVRTAGATTFVLRNADGTTTAVPFGQATDVPVTGDWNGDGVTEVGVWRPSAARFRLRVAPGVVKLAALGTVGSWPVTGNWNGDQVTDLGVYDPASKTFTLRTQAASGTVSVQSVVFGGSADLPVTGNWNGDRRTDLGVWSPGTATFSLRVAASAGATSATVTTKRFGLPRVR